MTLFMSCKEAKKAELILEKGERLSSVAELYWEPIFVDFKIFFAISTGFDRFSPISTDFQPKLQ